MDRWTFQKFIDLCITHNFYVIFIILVIISSYLSPLFFTTANIVNLLRQLSFIGLMSLGMTFVILTAGIDLSVGSILAFSTIFYSTLIRGDLYTFMPRYMRVFEEAEKISPVFPYPVNLLLTLVCVGILFGLINGVIVSKFKVPAFAATLGTMIVARGLAFSYTAGHPIFGAPDYAIYLANGEIAGISIPTLIWFASASICFIVLRYTSYGRHVYAVGGDEKSARLSGINVDWIKISVYGISGFFCALTGVIMVGRMYGAEPRIGFGYELEAIAAVVIGGTSLFGGRGGILGTVLGVIILGLIINILNLLEVSSYTQQVVKGLIIILALLVQESVSRIRRHRLNGGN
jgi:ribose/xylose/arabinose/galactoside ABC-type transport system permease subunit